MCFHLDLLGADRVRVAKTLLVLVGVADLVDCLPREVGDVLLAVWGAGGDLPRYRAVAFLELHLQRDPGAAVGLDVLVEDVRGDEVARPVGMPDRAVFRCLDFHWFHCWFSPCVAPRKEAAFVRSFDSSPQDRVRVHTGSDRARSIVVSGTPPRPANTALYGGIPPILAVYPA